VGLLDRLWRRPEKRELTLDKFRGLGLLDAPSSAGVVVNERTALNLSAYYNGIDLISGQIAGLPRKVFFKNAAGDREEAGANHPVQWMVHDEPNEMMTPFVFWQTLASHALSWGNGYAEIEWDKAMRPIGLWIMTPDRVTPEIAGGRLQYRVSRAAGGTIVLPAEDVYHLPGLGFDGIRGYSIASMAKQSLGLGLATEAFGSSFFGQGAWPGVVAEHPAKLSPEAQERLRASWNQIHQGPDKAHRLAILEEGMKLEKIGIPPEDAQFLQTREFQVVEIARWLNLPPHKLKHKVGERQGGNIEASQIEFLTDTLAPWLTRIEQEANRKLLSKGQRGTYYVQHVTNAILRTDAKTRMEVQKGYLDMGVLDVDQIAQQENLPKPKPKPAPAAPPPPVAPPPADDEPADDAADQAQRALVLDIAGWFLRRESEKARRASRRGPMEFQKWVEEFYGREVNVLAERLAPAVALRFALLGAKVDAAAMAQQMAEAWVARSKRELLSLRAAGLEEQTEQAMQRWSLHRPVEMADAFAALEEAHV
jgi:HK97 family phage portal protein